MDIAIIKTKEEFVAFSLFPIGVVGWGKTKKDAVNDIENNLYDYCNWIEKPLPKVVDAVVKEEYSGETDNVKFKSDDKSLLKKYAEITVQAAFSLKCMTDSFILNEEEQSLINEACASLSIADGGIIGHAVGLSQAQELEKQREFIYKVYKTAKQIFFLATDRGEAVTDTFKFKA